MSALYVKNDQTQSYDLYKETKRFEDIVDDNIYNNEVWYERGGIGEAADLYYINMEIQTVGNNKISLSSDDIDWEKWYFESQDGLWVPTSYERHNQIYTGDFSDSSKLKFSGDTCEIISLSTLSGDYSEGNIRHLLKGKDIMVKEIYKKK
jgi:hypothetical protein